MTKSSSVRYAIAVADPDAPDNQLKPNADGSINVGGSPAGTAQNSAITTQAGANPVAIATAAGADSVSNSGVNVLSVRAYNMLWNGATWDRMAKANNCNRLPSSAASVNATLVKSTPGNVHFVGGVNTNAAIRYLKLYNKASAPTIGTDTPLMTFALPATAPFNIPIADIGIYFPLGIGFGLTTGAPDADTGAVAAGDILGLNIVYS